MINAPTAHSLTLTDLLLRDPKHPDVRRLLLLHYENVCRQHRDLGREKGLLEDVLDLRRKNTTTQAHNAALDTEQRNRVG